MLASETLRAIQGLLRSSTMSCCILADMLMKVSHTCLICHRVGSRQLQQRHPNDDTRPGAQEDAAMACECLQWNCLQG